MIKTVEFRVGFLVLSIASIITVMIVFVSEDFDSIYNRTSHYFLLDDAGGLTRKSTVKMAGIDVGYVRDIKLYNDKARVEIAISPKNLSSDSYIEMRDDGLLGDRYVTIIPGESETFLPNNSEITQVIDGGTFDQAVDKMASLTDYVKLMPDLLGSESTTTQSSPLINVLKNLEVITDTFGNLAVQHKSQLSNLLVLMESVAGKLDKILVDDWQDSWDKIMNSVHNMEVSFANMKDITDKISAGEGSLGQLIHEEETVDNLNETISGLNKFIGDTSKIKTTLDLRGDYLTSSSAAKTNFSIVAEPGPDRHFQLSLIDDPISTGVSKLKVTLAYAHALYRFTIKGGIIENSGGFGLDYSFIPNKLKLALESFKFANRVPQLRSYIKYNLMKGMYLVGGMDQILENSSAFVGLGISVTSDELKQLAVLP